MIASRPIRDLCYQFVSIHGWQIVTGHLLFYENRLSVDKARARPSTMKPPISENANGMP